jgi:hypothetical protein
MSKIKVNQIEAATGSTVSIPSGQTLDVSNATVSLPASAVTAHQAGLTVTESQISDLGSYLTSVTNNNLSETVNVSKGGTGLTALGTAGQVLKVNSAGNALEYGEIPGFGGVLAVTDGGTGLSSLGTAGQTLAVNSGGTALEFVDAASGGGGSSFAPAVPDEDVASITGELRGMIYSPNPGDYYVTFPLTVSYDHSEEKISWTSGTLTDPNNSNAVISSFALDKWPKNTSSNRFAGSAPIFWEKDGSDYTGRYFECTGSTNASPSGSQLNTSGQGFTDFTGEWKSLQSTPDFEISGVFSSAYKADSAVLVGLGNPDYAVDNDWLELTTAQIYNLTKNADNETYDLEIHVIGPEYTHASANGTIAFLEFAKKFDGYANFEYTVNSYSFVGGVNNQIDINFSVSKKYEAPTNQNYLQLNNKPKVINYDNVVNQYLSSNTVRASFNEAIYVDTSTNVANGGANQALSVKIPVNPVRGDMIHVIDIGGYAATNNITIEGNGTSFSDGSTSKTINTNYGHYKFIWSGNNLQRWIDIS